MDETMSDKDLEKALETLSDDHEKIVLDGLADRVVESRMQPAPHAMSPFAALRRCFAESTWPSRRVPWMGMPADDMPGPLDVRTGTMEGVRGECLWSGEGLAVFSARRQPASRLDASCDRGGRGGVAIRQGPRFGRRNLKVALELATELRRAHVAHAVGRLIDARSVEDQ